MRGEFAGIKEFFNIHFKRTATLDLNTNGCWGCLGPHPDMESKFTVLIRAGQTVFFPSVQTVDKTRALQVAPCLGFPLPEPPVIPYQPFEHK